MIGGLNNYVYLELFRLVYHIWMTKQKSFQQQVADQMSKEALGIAKSIQRPEQTKQQTKLIAQGIAKGIEIYKKQFKEKTRNLDREKKKVARKSAELEQRQCHTQTKNNSTLGNKGGFALGACGIIFGLAAVLFFGLFVLNVDVKLATHQYSHTAYIPAGITMAGLSVWMFWARR